MKIQLKVLSVLAAALAVVFSTAGVSMAFSAPGEMANCRAVESGLKFECDPVSNLAVVNSSGVIPVTGFALPSITTSLRSINDLTFGADLSLSDFALTLPFVPELSLSDFAITVPPAPATSLRGINDVSLGAADLSLSDFALILPVVPMVSLSDFALTLPVVPVIGLSDFAISAAGLDSLSLSDFAISAVGLESFSLSDFALSQAVSDESMMELPLMEDAYSSGMYAGY